MPLPASPPAPLGSRAVQSAARRARLLDAAIELAAEGGYDAVQMRDVAARAGVALGTLYRNFQSKDELLLASLTQQMETLRTRIEVRPASGATSADRVANVLSRACRTLERQPNVTAAMITALTAADSSAAPVKLDVHDGFAAIISNALGDELIDDIDGIQRVLGHVWFSALVAWVGGTASAGQMANDLVLAAKLLLR